MDRHIGFRKEGNVEQIITGTIAQLEALPRPIADLGLGLVIVRTEAKNVPAGFIDFRVRHHAFRQWLLF